VGPEHERDAAVLYNVSSEAARLDEAPEQSPRAPDPARIGDLLSEAVAYQRDVWERSVLFVDALRQRADNMLAHARGGMPLLVDFEFENVLDARSFERPANYALLRVTRYGDACLARGLDSDKPPVVIIDPRSGLGPGVGGLGRGSEIGLALHKGYIVYFVTLYPEPCPGQTFADVQHALRRFVQTVVRLHGKPPILYANCQAGWAIVLLAADCQGLVGPVVLNGSPLSYWGESRAWPPPRLLAP
jgi:hypothetical protein